LERDLGVALARYETGLQPHEEVTRGYLRVAAGERLKASLARWPADVECWLALAGGRGSRGDAAARLKGAKAAVNLAPESEAAVTALTEAASAAGEYELAVESAGKWASLNPQSPDPLIARAFVHLKMASWEKAAADCRAALKLHPLHAEGHLYLAVCRHHQGDPEGGAKEAQVAAQLEPDPREREYLSEWYRRATR
jgi:tetratricopeptide (TPR) repeat protein